MNKNSTIFDIIFSKSGNNTQHIATVTTFEDETECSFSVKIDDNGNISYEYPELLPLLQAKYHGGKTFVVVLRTFNRDNMVPAPWKPEINVPMKTVRMWIIKDKQVLPVSESGAFSASTMNAHTGEPMPPEETVEYADGWPVQV